MWNQKPSFRFEIDSFSEKKAAVVSKTFVSGGCEWYLYIYPKGDRLADGHLSLYLHLANPTILRTERKMNANYYFVLLNQSDKELYRSPIGLASASFCAEHPSWGFRQVLPLSKFQEKGVLEKDILIIEVYMEVIEAVDGEDGDVSGKKKTVDVDGFQVLASQVTKVRKIFAEHPDLAKDFKPTKQEVKTAYINVLLKLIKTLQKPPKSISETRLRKACSELSELMNVGFKLDWLKLKLEEVSLARETSDADGSRVQQLEERVKNLELMELEFKLDCLNTKLDEVSLERTKLNDTDESRAQQLEKRVKNLELMELGLKLDSLNTKLDEVSLERTKLYDTDESRAQQLEERVKNLELMELEFKLDCLNTKLDEVSLDRKKSYDAVESRVQQFEGRVRVLGFKLDCLNAKLEKISSEKKKTDDADVSRVQQLEESVKNIELMVSYLKVELDKKKDKSSADGFLLVDEVA